MPLVCATQSTMYTKSQSVRLYRRPNSLTSMLLDIIEQQHLLWRWMIELYAYLASIASLPAVRAATDEAATEFSNSFFSDLAPLLTLFGEQVTKQFLSQSH